MKNLNKLSVALMLALGTTFGMTSCGDAAIEESATELPPAVEEVAEEEVVVEDVVVVEETVAADDGAEWDEYLDDYEEYMDDYIELMKNMKDDPSDMSILTEYQSLMEKGQEWSTKMSDASGDFGVEQLARMQEIQAKMLKAM
jgi:hypothetical protein